MLTPVQEIPPKMRPSKSFALLNEFLEMKDVRFVETDIKPVNATLYRMTAQKHSLPVAVHVRAGKVYFERL